MVTVAKKCYYSNFSKTILFDFYSRNHENVENVIATIELSPDGRVLKTEIDWRPEMFEEFHNSLIQARNNIVESRLLLGMISNHIKKSLSK